MPRYLIHVGPHKTATTYLQQSFAAKRQNLSAAGVAYPAVWSSAEDEPSHRKLVIALRDGRISDLKSQFDAIERDAPEYVLVSGEGLNLLPSAALAVLKMLLRNNPVTIIFYCRRWSELLPSLWQERAKHGYEDTLPEFILGHLTDPDKSDVINFARRLAIYAGLFGRENIKLVCYNQVCDDQMDIATHFYDTFLTGCRFSADDLPGRPNKSLDPLEVEVIRALNTFAISHNVRPPNADLRNWYVANAWRFDLDHLRETMQECRTSIRFSDSSPGLRQIHDALLAVYGELAVHPAPSRGLFAPGDADLVFFRQRYLSDQISRQTLADIYESYRQEVEIRLPCP